MRKNLVAALVSLGLCGGAAAAIAAGTTMTDAPKAGPLVSQMTPAAQAQDNPAPDAAIRLAQAGGRNPPPPPPRATNPGRGPGRAAAARPAPTAAQLAERRTQLCQDSYARAAGSLASLEVRLNLTAAQGAAFTRWRDVRLAAVRRAASDCVARPAPQGRGGRGGRGAAGTTGGAAATPPSPVERMAREETMLQQRLSNLQAERPALDALYSSLTPAQRQTFARQNRGGPMMGGMRGRGPGMRGRGPMMQRGPGFGRGPGMRGPGMRGSGPMRPMPPRGGNSTPPPPAQ